MQRKSFRVNNPCNEPWEDMSGNDKVRFCTHCAKDVNNLSAMTRKEAVRLVRKSGGSLCIRYAQHPVTKRPLFAEQLTQITRRRTPLMAAGVMSASLSLASLTYAQGGPMRLDRPAPSATSVRECEDVPAKNGADVAKRPAMATQVEETARPTRTINDASVSGTVMDPNGAVIPNALVSLISNPNGPIRTKRTDEAGTFRFDGVKPGLYAVSSEMEHFKTTVVENLTVGESGEIVANMSMDVAGIPVVVGDIMVAEVEGDLAMAVANDDIEATRELLARGEDVNRKEEDGKTPLHIAVENGNLEMVQLLLTFGAKVNARTVEKMTPLMHVDEDASAELVRTLIRYGAKVDRIAKGGETALIVAVREAKAEVVQALVDAGAKLDVQDNEGLTALMEAAADDDLEKARILVLAGANVNLKDNDGETAWDQTTNEELEKLLETYGAVVDDGVD